MNETKLNLNRELNLITNCITSTAFLTRVKDSLSPHLLQVDYSKTVVNWCLEYFHKCKEAPGRNIQDIYISKKSFIHNEDELELIATYLHALSANYKDRELHNLDYSVSEAINYLRIRQLVHTKERLEEALEEDNADLGESVLGSHKRLEEARSEGIDILRDAQKINNAFNNEKNVMFNLDGDLGQAVGDFQRGDFCLIMGQPKVGKSWASSYVGNRAALLGFRVFVVNVEMDENQCIRRSWMSFLGLPREAGVVKIPYFDTAEAGKFSIKYKDVIKEAITGKAVKKEQDKLKRIFRGGGLKIETFTSGASTFSDVMNRLENLKYYENWIPDVVVWDYPDILAPEIKGSTKEQSNDIQKKIRGLAQVNHQLHIAVTQVNAAGWEKDLKGSDAADNKDKIAHATKVIALNQTPEEREKQIIRVQHLYERDGHITRQQVVVLQALEIGRWYVNSKFQYKISN